LIRSFTPASASALLAGLFFVGTHVNEAGRTSQTCEILRNVARYYTRNSKNFDTLNLFSRILPKTQQWHGAKNILYGGSVAETRGWADDY
jgi:hypothetical protein